MGQDEHHINPVFKDTNAPKLSDKLYIYFKLYILEIRSILNYKFSFTFDIVLGFVSPIFLMILWSTVAQFSSNGKVGDFNKYSIAGYFLIGGVLQKLNSTFVAKNIMQLVKGKSAFSGSFYFLNSINFCIYFIVKFLAAISSIFIISSTVVVIIILLVPELGKAVSTDPFNILFFCLFCILGFLSQSAFFTIIGLLRFYLISANSLRNVLYNVVALFSGKFLPLAFLPPALTLVLGYLPFSFTYYYPLSIILGKKSHTEILIGTAVCITWILLMFVIARKLYKKAIKYYENFD